MKTFLIMAGLAIPLLLLSACSGGGSDNKQPQTPAGVTGQFLSLWQEKQYSDMYDLLSQAAQSSITREKFVERYQAIAEEATITGVDFDPITEPSPETATPEAVPQDAAEIAVRVTLHTAFFGDIRQENSFALVHETVTIPPTAGSKDKSRQEQQWRIQWQPALIFKELDGRSLVHYFARIPKRGSIYDRNSQPLAVDADLPVIGVVPDLITDREAVIATLSAALGMGAAEVRALVEANVPSYYFIPVKTLGFGIAPDQLQPFYDMNALGVVVQPKTQRIYPYGDSAAHVLGYMREVTEEDLQELSSGGYGPSDRIGAAGLESAFQDVLAGKRGGLLATIAPEGNIIHTIAEKPAEQGQDIYLALDINVQKAAEAALGERAGSSVVMDPRDNSVLALASFPRYNPNDFLQGLSAEQANALLNDPWQPFLHRPLLATYPPGSTFKVVTGAAGLERGGFTPSSTIPCTPLWYGLGDAFVKANWQTVNRGAFTIAQGLMASCNPVFYETALTLDGIDQNILPQFTRDFGFGAPTGIGLLEAEGIAPGPEWKERELSDIWYPGDSVNMGIGQGYLLATPMQITNMYSAIAGGAILRKPLLIKKIAAPSGAVREFAAEPIRQLPVSETTLAAIRDGLRRVVQDPGGTSYQVFAGSNVDAAGKSGTAEDLSFGSDHVFFVAYANRSNPSIVALIALEEGKSGSAEAGPRVRQILETFAAP